MAQRVGIIREGFTQEEIIAMTIYKGQINGHVTVVNTGGRLEKGVVEQEVINKSVEILEMVGANRNSGMSLMVTKVNKGILQGNQITTTEISIKILEI